MPTWDVVKLLQLNCTLNQQNVDKASGTAHYTHFGNSCLTCLWWFENCENSKNARNHSTLLHADVQATQVCAESGQIGPESDLGHGQHPHSPRSEISGPDRRFLPLFPRPIAPSFFIDTLQYLFLSVPYYSTLDGLLSIYVM